MCEIWGLIGEVETMGFSYENSRFYFVPECRPWIGSNIFRFKPTLKVLPRKRCLFSIQTRRRRRRRNEFIIGLAKYGVVGKMHVPMGKFK